MWLHSPSAARPRRLPTVAENIPTPPLAADLSASEFRGLFGEVSNWGRWGEPRTSAVRSTTSPPTRVAAAAAGADRGDRDAQPAARHRGGLDNPEPADHHMTMLADADIGSGPLRFAKDFIGVDYHNDGHSHIDALCHVAYDGALYNGHPAGDRSPREGAGAGAIDVLKDGLVGRGVLLDVPRARGVAWLEPGEHVFLCGPRGGRARPGRARRRGRRPAGSHRPCASPGRARAVGHARREGGPAPHRARFLAERGVAALGSDGNSDTAPSTTEGIDFPIHVLALNAMGLHLLDYLQFEDLAGAASTRGAGSSCSSPPPCASWRYRIAAQPDRRSSDAAPGGGIRGRSRER